MKVTPFPAKVRHFKKWRTNIIDDEVFDFVHVVNGKAVPDGTKGILVLRTKGRKTSIHGVMVPPTFGRTYHANCRIEIRQNLDGKYEWVRCI
jgi:hypothetical protein